MDQQEGATKAMKLEIEETTPQMASLEDERQPGDNHASHQNPIEGVLQPTIGRLNAIFQARKAQHQEQSRAPWRRFADAARYSLPQLMKLCRDAAQSAQQRDAAAEELRRRLKMRMRGKISESLTRGTSQTLDDLTQIALIRILSSRWTALDTDTSEKGYALLDTICRSVVQDALRKTFGRGDVASAAPGVEPSFLHQQRRMPAKSLSDPRFGEEDGVAEGDLLYDPSPQPDEQVAQQMQSEMLQKLLRESLTEGEMAVLRLNVFEGLSLKEVADTLHISHEAARTRSSRALKQLRGNPTFRAHFAAA